MTRVTFPSKKEIGEAAARLRRGELVAFPTETVYGLGAHALDTKAVERIFGLKQRPKTSPLIVHVATVAAAQQLVTEWPAAAERLAQQFWPGPLTLVLPKRGTIPDIVTAGLGTVGVRVPRHSVALELLQEAGVPVAAPSANLFTRLSPTAREHVTFENVLVLEGGDSEVGIESTVLSLAGPARLLRPGAVSRAELELVIGPVLVTGALQGESPGLHAQHYRPQTPACWAAAVLPEGRGAYLFIEKRRDAEVVIRMPSSPALYAAELYRVLHRLDQQRLEWIAVEPLPDKEEWLAVQDRLQRALDGVHGIGLT